MNGELHLFPTSNFVYLFLSAQHASSHCSNIRTQFSLMCLFCMTFVIIIVINGTNKAEALLY
jgi:hypothetical protein